jgi:drug/metabolite transporter (DMT)-like permease
VSPLALGLVLAAALFHALWNRLLHVTGDRVATMAVANFTAGVLLVPATILAPPRGVLSLIALSALAESIYALLLSAAYRRGGLSVAYPLGRGTAPLLVTLGGWLVLSQQPGPLAIAGAVSLASGMALVAGAGHKAGQGTAVGFALLVGCAIASYSVVDARAVSRVSAPGYIGAVFLLTGILLVCWLRGDRARLRNAAGPGVKVAFGSAAAYLLVLLAFQHANAGRVATIREVSVLIGIWLSGERPGRLVWAGAVCIVAGIVLAAV